GPPFPATCILPIAGRSSATSPPERYRRDCCGESRGGGKALGKTRRATAADTWKAHRRSRTVRWGLHLKSSYGNITVGMICYQRHLWPDVPIRPALRQLIGTHSASRNGKTSCRMWSIFAREPC